MFECPIDLLSYLTLIKMQTDKWLSESMLSLGGVYVDRDRQRERKVR